MEISKLYIYPIKSLLPISLSEATVTECGLQYDRQYALVHFREGNPNEPEVLTIKTISELCLFQPAFDEAGENIVVTHNLSPSTTLTLPLTPSPEFLAGARSYPISLFSTSTTGIDMGDLPAAFFRAHLNIQSIRVLYIGGPRDPHPVLTPSVTESKQTKHPQKIRFMDAAPILLTTSASLKDITARLPPSAGVVAGGGFSETKFRSNIHITVPDDTPAYSEEFWAKISVGEQRLKLDCTYNTVRCLSINVDYSTGKQAPPEEQIYKLMAKDRRINPTFEFKPCFGRYCFCDGFGERLRVGDKVLVEKRNQERHVEVS